MNLETNRYKRISLISLFWVLCNRLFSTNLEEALDQCHEFLKIFKYCGIGVNSELTLTVGVYFAVQSFICLDSNKTENEIRNKVKMPSSLQGLRQSGQENHATFENPSSKEPRGSDLGGELQQSVARPGSRPAFAGWPQRQKPSTFPPPCSVQIPEEIHAAAQMDACTLLAEAMLPLPFPQEQFSAPPNFSCSCCCHKILLCAWGFNELKHQQYHQALPVALALQRRQLD